MYGIVLDDAADPELVTKDWDELWRLMGHAQLLTATSQTHYKLWAVVLDPDCACGEEVPGWYEIDRNGDLLEPALHDRCRRAYEEERAANRV